MSNEDDKFSDKLNLISYQKKDMESLIVEKVFLKHLILKLRVKYRASEIIRFITSVVVKEVR